MTLWGRAMTRIRDCWFSYIEDHSPPGESTRPWFHWLPQEGSDPAGPSPYQHDRVQVMCADWKVSIVCDPTKLEPWMGELEHLYWRPWTRPPAIPVQTIGDGPQSRSGDGRCNDATSHDLRPARHRAKPQV